MGSIIHQKDRLDQNPIEVLVADIRNKLTPFWLLVDIANNESIHPGFNLKEHAQLCESQKKIITDNLSKINEISVQIENETAKEA